MSSVTGVRCPMQTPLLTTGAEEARETTRASKGRLEDQGGGTRGGGESRVEIQPAWQW